MATVTKRAWKTSRGEQRTAWRCDFVDAAGRRQRRQFATKREADAFRIEVEAQMRAGTFRADADKVTVREAAESYLEYVEGRMQRGERFTRHHLKTVQGHVWNYIDPELRPAGQPAKTRATPFSGGVGNVKLAHLRPGAVCDFRDRLRQAGVGVVTTRKILATLRQVLKHAKDRDLIAVNAAEGVEVIGRRDEGPRKITPPAKADMRALMEAADPDFRGKLMFAAATGVRAGELHALRWRHLDLAGGEVTIETRVDAYGDEDVTKTAAGMRSVPIGEHVVKAMKEWKLRAKFTKPDDLVFPNRRGGYTCHDNMVKRRFHPVCEAAGLTLNWHALRHFAISCWIEAGFSPKTVQTFAGHTSLQVTMDRYGHLFPSEDHRHAMNAIAKQVFQ